MLVGDSSNNGRSWAAYVKFTIVIPEYNEKLYEDAQSNKHNIASEIHWSYCVANVSGVKKRKGRRKK